MKRSRPTGACTVSQGAQRRVIVCFDLDAFYAQVVEIENPSLKGRPVAIQQKYIVVTANYEARKLGVKKLGNLQEAKKIVPGLVVVDGSDLTRFRAASESINKIWESYGCPVERLGMDEVFLDVTSMVHSGGPMPAEDCHIIGEAADEDPVLLQMLHAGAAFAQKARARLHRELGFKCCAGIACGKIAAKLAAEWHKPNQQTLLLPNALLPILRRTLVSKIQGIGRKSRLKLDAACGFPGSITCGDVQALGRSGVFDAIGNDQVALFVWQAVSGIDSEPVKSSGLAKTISVEETSLPHPESLDAARARLATLCARLLPMAMSRLEKAGDFPQMLRLTINNAAHRNARKVGSDRPSLRSRYRTESKSTSAGTETFCSAAAIQRASDTLLRSLCPPGASIKLSRMNLAACNFAKVSAKHVKSTRSISSFLTGSPAPGSAPRILASGARADASKCSAWVCARCTFENKKMKNCCEMCGSMKSTKKSSSSKRPRKGGSGVTIVDMFQMKR